ncbi:MAG TPA: SRPBCC family protein [Streptosporangiaceae bacterium]|nr:SRPBCC family protein [Streptosporangiaceae bacterium]
MARYETTVTSRRPAAETFTYLAVFSNAAIWDPGVLAAEQLDPGPVGPGTRFRLTVPFLGRPMPLTYRITSYDHGRRVVLTATSRLLRATDTIAVSGGADGSAVSYEAEVRLRGPLQILDPLLRPGFRAVAERAAAGLARALSDDPAPTEPPEGQPVPPRRATTRCTEAP